MFDTARVVARELDLIVVKALARDRDRRPATANGLAADLRRHLNREPVTAAPPTLGYQPQLFYRRHPSRVGAAGAVAVLPLAVTVVSIAFTIRARRADAWARRQVAIAHSESESFWKAVFTQLVPWQHTNRTVTCGRQRGGGEGIQLGPMASALRARSYRRAASASQSVTTWAPVRLAIASRRT